MLAALSSFLWRQSLIDGVAISEGLVYAESSTKAQAASTTNQAAINKVAQEMNRRATNVGYGLGVALGRATGTRKKRSQTDLLAPDSQAPQSTPVQAPRSQPSAAPRARSRDPGNPPLPRDNGMPVPSPKANKANSYLDAYGQIFPHDSIRVIYAGLDVGVEDWLALTQMLIAQVKTALGQLPKKISLEGIVPTVGSVSREQSIKNTLRLLVLTSNQSIKVFSGAAAPLALEGNETALAEMNHWIKEAAIYGLDGLQNSTLSTPEPTLTHQDTEGFRFIAETVASSPKEKNIALVATSALTTIAKAFQELERLESDQGIPSGTLFKNIAALSIAEGYYRPETTPDAALEIFQRNSNFNFDPAAAQIVFSLSQRYHVPIILAPLALTEQTELSWSPTLTSVVKTYATVPSHNPVATFTAAILTDFTNSSRLYYTMPAFQAVLNIMYPEEYSAPMRKALEILGQGETQEVVNASDAIRNVYVLTLPQFSRSALLRNSLRGYEVFTNPSMSENVPKAIPNYPPGIIATIVAVAVVTFGGLGLLFFCWFKIVPHCVRRRAPQTEPASGAL